MRFVRSISFAFVAAFIAGCSSGGGCGSCGVHTLPATPTPAPGGTAVTVNFGTQTVLPTHVAVQFGTGAFTDQTLSGHTLAFTVPSGTTSYAVAYACPPVSGFGVVVEDNVVDATLSDLTSYSVTPCASSATAGAVTGSVDATVFPTATGVAVRGADDYGANVSSASGTFSTTMLLGSNDVAAAAQDTSSNVLGVKILRAQTSPGAIAPLTFAAGDATASQTIAAVNINAGFNPAAAIDATYNTASGTSIDVTNNGETTYGAVAATEAVSGDYYTFSANDADTTTHQLVGIAEDTTTGGSAVTLSLPPPWTYAGPTAALFPTFTYGPYTDFSGDAYQVDVAYIDWVIGSTNYAVHVTATRAYVGSSGTVAIPNLTTLTGFTPSAAAGTSILWEGEIDGSTYPSWAELAPPNGAFTYVQTTGNYTQP